MIKNLKEKLAPKNNLVDFYQHGLLSEDEFQREMARLNLSEAQANDLFGGITDNWPEEHGAVCEEDGWEV